MLSKRAALLLGLSFALAIISVYEFEPKEKKLPSEKDPALKNKFEELLEKKEESPRTLIVPNIPQTTPTPLASPVTVPLPLDIHAQGRQKRKTLPMGIVLWDQVTVTKDPEGKSPLYAIRSGDIVRVYKESLGQPRLHVHPGVDVYLAEITQNIEAAGKSYPDLDGWVQPGQVQILTDEQALDFTQTVQPMTLGEDSNFSMISFYERAMKNPDPVVHRIIGPRLLGIVSLHEEYVSSWQSLYRDPDAKIRTYTLAQLRERGIDKSRPILEDLIVRLTELTKTRATDEKEIEVLIIIDLLKASHHPRALTAFESFKEAWAGKQSQKIIEALKEE